MKVKIHVPTTCLIPCHFVLECLLGTLKEMFPGETEEYLITTLTKNNFDLETSVNGGLCSKAGKTI